MKCKNCGNDIEEKSLFCINCGMKVVQSFDNNKNQIKTKLVIVALLMLIFPLFLGFLHFKYNWLSNTIFLLFYFREYCKFFSNTFIM